MELMLKHVKMTEETGNNGFWLTIQYIYTNAE